MLSLGAVSAIREELTIYADLTGSKGMKNRGTVEVSGKTLRVK
jgi:hypothetical protein